MSIFPIDPALAAKALKLQRSGLKGKAISEKLGKGFTTSDANVLASCGHAAESEEKAGLTERETAILLALAAIMRERRAEGMTSSPKAKQIAWRLRLSEGQVRRATTRIRERDFSEARDVVRLGLLSHSVNGHIWMLPAGWTVVHEIERAAVDLLAIVRQVVEQAAGNPGKPLPDVLIGQAVMALEVAGGAA